VRLFVALELPGAVVAAARGWALEAARGLRVLPPESLHVTLAFLGETPEDRLDELTAIVRGVSPHTVGGLSLHRAAALGRGRALSIDLHDRLGECAGLQAALSERLAALGVYEPERRAFRPHLTVARGDRVRVRGLPPLPDCDEFAGEAVTLFRSHLGRGGARYEALVSVPLGVEGR
jgi:2'-5' RNA ligase